ncbi:MAG TPA: phosphate signaling complex protein PhoU [Chloroflexi bacterium]|nr:phosphate signaling complex protein PhoU [Chloroflexota bacterium]
MPRTVLETELKNLKGQVLKLGQMVGEAMLAAIEALKHRDIEKARQIMAADSEINALRFEIERATLIVIATQQPLAHDLRLLASILDIAGELERMGDYAKGIAKINILMGDKPLLKPLIDLPRMAEIATDMLRQSLAAFSNDDAEAARAIPQRDDEVDALYNQIYRELMTFMLQDPKTIDQANYLLWAAHNVERLADRVTNICERTVFTATGEIVELA